MVSVVVAEFVAGWVGGIFCVVIGYPFDTIKVRQQHFSTTLPIAARETYKHEGILGFFKGMSSPLMAYGPSNSIFFGCTGTFINFLNRNHDADEAPHHVNQKPTFLWKYFCAGCVGGLSQAIVMCPVELVKIALQTSTEGKSAWVHNTNILTYEGSRHAFRTIVHIRGFKGLYTGFVPMMFRDVPTSGLYFVIYETLMPNNRNDVQWYHKLWAGGWAGITSISSVLPFDVIKTRMQADDILYPRYNGMIDCAKKLYFGEGYRIFWKGLPIITLRAFPAHAMMFVGYETTLDALLGK